MLTATEKVGLVVCTCELVKLVDDGIDILGTRPVYSVGTPLVTYEDR